MATLINSNEVQVVVDYRLVGLLDVTCDDGGKPPSPHTLGHWIATTHGNVSIEDIDERPAVSGPMRLEAWDGPAEFDPTGWLRHDVIEMDLPSGMLGVDSLTAGKIPKVYQLPAGKRWYTRLAWRTVPRSDPSRLPRASILVQFWPAD